MAVREYIGARYVPKFMGAYVATQAYEALCVVDNGLGTSYISKVPTPAGTPLTDTDYWAVYGASSGAIINLQNQIDTINNTTIPGVIDLFNGQPFYNVKEKHVNGVPYETEINNAFNTYDFIIFPEGLYEINSPLKITRNVTVLLHGNAEIRATTAMSYMLGINPDNLPPSDLTDSQYTAQGSIFLKPNIIGGFFNANNLAERGLVVNNYYHSMFKNIVIVDFTDTGIVTAFNSGRGGAHSGFDNITLRGANANCGFELNAPDDYINDCAVINCKVGYKLYAGDLRLQNCTAWLGFGAESLFEGSIAYDTLYNNSSGFLDNCNLDTMQTGVSIKNATSWAINDFLVTINKDVIDPALYNPISVFDITFGNTIVKGTTINNVIDTYDFNHYFIKSSSPNTLLAYTRLNNIDFVHDPSTYVIDYPDNIIPTLFKTQSSYIDCKIVSMGSQFVLYFKILQDFTMNANESIAGGILAYTLFSSGLKKLPAMLYDASNNVIVDTDVSLEENARQLFLHNRTASAITIHRGEYIGFYNAIQ